jgi:hypothetical protein
MKLALVCMLALTGCGYGSLALREERLAETRSQLGDPVGAAEAKRRADAYKEMARLHATQGHGWLWHELAMD